MPTPRTKLSVQQCRWLIGFVEKNIAENECCNAEIPNRIFDLRIANMQDLKVTLENMMEKELRRQQLSR